MRMCVCVEGRVVCVCLCVFVRACVCVCLLIVCRPLVFGALAIVPVQILKSRHATVLTMQNDCRADF